MRTPNEQAAPKLMASSIELISDRDEKFSAVVTIMAVTATSLSGRPSKHSTPRTGQRSSEATTCPVSIMGR